MKCPNCGTKTDKNFCPECGTLLNDTSKKQKNICPNCGAESDTKFCPECGTLMNAGAPKEHVCPNCGEKTTSKFCGSCGYDFTKQGNSAIQNQNIQTQTTGKTSMILGIISCGCLFFGWSSIASIILGSIGLKKAKEESDSGEKTVGYVLSLIGLIGGIIEFVYCVVCLLFLGQFATTFFNIFNNTMNQYNDVLNNL